MFRDTGECMTKDLMVWAPCSMKLKGPCSIRGTALDMVWSLRRASLALVPGRELIVRLSAHVFVSSFLSRMIVH